MDIRIGSLVYGKGGVGNPVVAIDDEILTIDTPKGLRLVPVSKILRVQNPTANPRDAISLADGRMSVDLDRLDLNIPVATFPTWHPSTSVKPYEQLTKLYIDIETTGLNPEVDRVLMVGLMNELGHKTIITDADERVMLDRTIQHLRQHHPECLIGHNLFAFDLPFIARRSSVNGIAHPFTKGSKLARITSSSHNGQPIEYFPIYWRGTNILDTFQQVAIWDKAAAMLTSYGLKNSVIALGLRDDRRLELDVNQIRECWDSGDLATIEEYLAFDLDDTKLLADRLLPVVYYQLNYVPNLNLQTLATASPALKTQKIHQQLLPKLEPTPDEPVKYDGGKVELLKAGLHRNVAKIDVSSLYPSIMLRYGLCSRKDAEHRFLGVLEYMRAERLRLKALGKQGDRSASFQEQALKVLINGSYGFFGTGGYSFNDYQAAALVTAYGRKILNLMVEVVDRCGGEVIEIDTDGVFFSHNEPETVYQVVAEALPAGISIELELQNYGLYAPKAKSYVLVSPQGKVSVKGIFRKRNRYPLANEFPTQFIKLYFMEGVDAAEKYYQETRSCLASGDLPIEDLTITRKISSSEKNLVALGLGKPGETVSFWYGRQLRYHSKTGRQLSSVAIETNSGEYWAEYYLTELDEAYRSILGIEKSIAISFPGQLKLELSQPPPSPNLS